MPKNKPLNRKQSILVAKVAKGHTGTDAAIISGTPVASAHVYASKTLAKPNVQAALTAAMNKAGLSIAKVGRLIHHGATEATSLYGPKSIEHPDYTARAKYTDMALKVMGGYAPARIDANVKLGIVDLIDAANVKREGSDG